jgi:hypothetical protein
MSNPASGWGTGSTGGGDVAYASGGLQLAADNGAFLWSNRPTGRSSNVMVVAGQATPSSGGLFGLLCDAGEEHLVGAVLETTGEWYFVGIDNTSSTPVVTTLAHSDAAAVDFPVNELATMALVCAGTSTGKLRMELWMAAEGTVATYESGDGPASFDGAAVYAEGTSDGYSALVSQVNVLAVGDGTGTMSASAQALLSHVPSDWQQDCFEEPVPAEYGTSEQTALSCFLGQQRAGAEIAEYASYSSSADMLETYTDRMSLFPPDDADSCQDGSREAGYTIGSDPAEAGRLLCTPQWAGIRFEWTDNKQLILSTLIDFDGDYGATYSDWQNAGPNPGS